MELPGTTYLQTLAMISITFGGFAALVAIFRQTIGGRLSDFDMFFIRQNSTAELNRRWLQYASIIARVV